MRTDFWCGNLTEGDHFEDLVIDNVIILKLVVKQSDGWR